MSSRKPLIAGNWKLHKTVAESVAFVQSLKNDLGQVETTEVVVAPTFLALYPVAEVLRGSAIQVAAQNVYPKASGAYTGEISAPLLRAAGCSFGIVGHSERRTLFHESDASVADKVLALYDADITPILCLGEDLDQRDTGRTFEVVASQLQAVLPKLSPDKAPRLVIAYEPVWAIGTGKTASPAQAQEVHAFLRSLLQRHFSPTIAQAIRILYGGSVKPENIDSLMREPDIDGALVGGASLDIPSFLRLIRFAL